jgi:2-C-methyl-D-erythritol 4-phosphate cytidylyltransferase
MERLKTAAIITAGGLGLRLPGETRKQFRLLDGKPLIVRAIEPFLKHEGISNLVLTLPGGEEEQFENIRVRYLADKLKDCTLRICIGGVNRQDSVFNALKICPADTDLVAVHDGVRPFLMVDVLNRLLELAGEYGAAIPGAPVKNTIKTIKEDIVDHTIRRDILIQVYTPQIFNYNILMKCYHRAMMEEYYSTDDAALLEHYGYSVHYLIDDTFNLKITDELDLFLAEQYIRYYGLKTKARKE